MSKRSPKKSTLALPSSPSHTVRISDVKVGWWCRLEDGQKVRIAAVIEGSVFVRFKTHEPRRGPVHVPHDSLVTDVEAPELVAADRSAVKDPLEAA